MHENLMTKLQNSTRFQTNQPLSYVEQGIRFVRVPHLLSWGLSGVQVRFYSTMTVVVVGTLCKFTRNSSRRSIESWSLIRQHSTSVPKNNRPTNNIANAT